MTTLYSDTMQDQMPLSPADEPIFQALLVPHRSLGHTGFLLVISAFAGAWLATGAIFLAYGAWPVLGFFGLDLALLYGAFHYNFREAKRREEIRISRTCLEIRQIAPSGKATLHCFNPFWTRFDVTRKPEAGIIRMAVACRGAAVTIGGFLHREDRENFANAFSRALSTAKYG